MTEFLNQTKNRRKENYDFISQIMQSHQIKLEQLESPKQSVQSSQFTDQVLRIINSKHSLQTGPSSPHINEAEWNNQCSEDIPIINEIDEILNRIKNKYQQSPQEKPQASPNKHKNMQLDEEEDFVYKIKQKVNTKLGITNSAKQKQLEKQTTSEAKSIQTSNKPQRATVQQNEIKQDFTFNYSNQNIQLESEREVKPNQIKDQVRRLQNSFKKPTSTRPPQPTPPHALREQADPSEAPVIEFEPSKNLLTIFSNEYPARIEHEETELDNKSDYYVTPTKKPTEAYSQLSYSQSQLNSGIRSEPQTQQKPNEKQQERNLQDDPVLDRLIKEEIMLLSRLQQSSKKSRVLQRQLQYEESCAK